MEFGFLIPVLFWGLSRKTLCNRFGDRFSSAECGLIALLLTGVVIAVGVQILSAVHALNFVGFLFIWGIAVLGALMANRQCDRATSAQKKGAFWLKPWADGWESLVLALVIYATVVLVGLVAVFAVPNNCDSMGYHLARVAYWRQYGSISFFATSNPRQNNLNPFAEWAVLQLSYLQGRIALSNTIQWVAYLGSILSVSEITRLLGGGRRECLISAFFCATLPMTILEATSTQNDLTESFWLVVALYGCLKSISEPGWISTVILGAALGLALLTKATAVIFAAPIMALFFCASLQHGWKKLVINLVTIGALVLCLNVGHFLRNMETSGSPLGPDGSGNGHEYTNEIHTPAAIVSNIARSIALHGEIFNYGTPTTTAAILKLHQWLGLSPNDSRTSSDPGNTMYVWFENEDGCPMPVQLLVILMGCVWIACLGRTRYSLAFYGTMGSVLLGAFLFCYVLKWQVFNVRLQLPLFVMATPIAAAFIERETKVFVRCALLIFILGCSAKYICFNPFRPAFGSNSIFVAKPVDQRYCILPSLRDPYKQALRILEDAKVRTVGLYVDNSFDYFLLDPNEDGYPPPFTIDHVLVNGIYSRFETKEAPDAVVSLDEGPRKTIIVHGKTYRNVYPPTEPDSGPVSVAVFLPEAPSPHP